MCEIKMAGVSCAGVVEGIDIGRGIVVELVTGRSKIQFAVQ